MAGNCTRFHEMKAPRVVAAEFLQDGDAERVKVWAQGAENPDRALAWVRIYVQRARMMQRCQNGQ